MIVVDSSIRWELPLRRISPVAALLSDSRPVPLYVSFPTIELAVNGPSANRSPLYQTFSQMSSYFSYSPEIRFKVSYIVS